MKNIITIQHTEAAHHLSGVVGSWADYGLTGSGAHQAERIGERLKCSVEIRGKTYKMYASDLVRAKQTAAIVGNFLGIEPIISTDLRERNLGEASGKTIEWARENEVRGDFLDEKPFNGAESIRETWNRLKKFHDEIMASDDENIIIVSHGETLSLFYAIWLDWEVEMLDKYRLRGRTGGVSFLKEDSEGKRIIERLNDMYYKTL